MNFNPILAVFHARSNSTGQIGSKSIEFQPNLSSISCLVKLGVNP